MEPAELIARYRTKGVLLDTNLLVLLAIGIYRPNRVATFKRTKKYTSEDFSLVDRIVGSFDRRITTPHILTEAHSLARQLPEAEHSGVAAVFRHLIEEMFEVHVPAVEAAATKVYPRLGLTDSAIIEASAGILVVTDDLPLSLALSKLGRDVINLNHIRLEIWT